MPKKIFIGIDASGDKGFKMLKWFSLVAVTCSDLNQAEKAVKEIDVQWPAIKGKKRKGKNLHKFWLNVIKILKNYDLRYYLLLDSPNINKHPIVVENYKTVNFTQHSLKYGLIHDRYAKHGWLVIDTLRFFGYKGPSEIKIDKDLDGIAWNEYKSQLKTHAENHLGHCDIADSNDNYPLIRIADIIANFSYNQIKKQTPIKLPELGILKELGKYVAGMIFVLELKDIDYSTGKFTVNNNMLQFQDLDFTPYSDFFLELKIIVQKSRLHIKSLFRSI